MLVRIRPWPACADEPPLLLTDPFEGRIPHATDDGQPRGGHAVRLRTAGMAGDHVTNGGVVALDLHLDEVSRGAMNRALAFLSMPHEWHDAWFCRKVAFSRVLVSVVIEFLILCVRI